MGKSSLLNALLGRRLAIVSKTPGRTQMLNYYSLRDALYLVDLPGFGHADAPPDLVRRWNVHVRRFVASGRLLRRVVYLVDARHGLQRVDHDMLALLDKARTPFQLVLTKADKLGASERRRAAVAEAVRQRARDSLSCVARVSSRILSANVRGGLTHARARAAAFPKWC